MPGSFNVAVSRPQRHQPRPSFTTREVNERWGNRANGSYPPPRVILETGSCSGYAVLRGEKAPDDALARELGAMGLL
jgi:hypothetical protein